MSQPHPQTPPASPVIRKEEANEQQMLPYDQNLGKLRQSGKEEEQEPQLTDTPSDENLVDDDIIEEGDRTR
jgi:hypothetical protein